MINPAEDIVNLWLQECYKHFTMSNVVVHKGKRMINNKIIAGGRGKEIDILSYDGKSYYWTEVSVSPNPRLSKKITRLQEVITAAIKKFDPAKDRFIKSHFQGKRFKRQFVYSPKLFTKKGHEEDRFRNKLKARGINAVNFDRILREVYEKLTYMGYDVTRNYLYLLKKFNYSAHI